ncbi:MAG: 2Fe-2S iron-sulfur cluster-binding protein [Ramlibacter sp.]|nr:2Fe-2S iron-sulfur cluster-binding protein [Ramlibacter sp.]
MGPAVLALSVLALAAFLAAATLLVRGVSFRPKRPMRLVVARRADHPGDLFTLLLRRPAWTRLLPLPRFAGGQSVALAIPGEAASRRYSIARWRPLPFSYELTIKREPCGRFSPRLAAHARPGAHLLVGRPDGRFVLPKQTGRRRIVLIAGGVGVTPLLAMLDEWRAARRCPAQAHFYWQVRHEEDAIYGEALASLAQRHSDLRARILVSRPARGSAQRISAALLAAELGTLADSDFLICAGSDLLEALRAQLTAAGVPANALHFERFTLAHPAGEDLERTVAFGGERFSFAGHGSLLDAIEAQRLTIDADCRTGSCGRCLLALEEGEVAYRVTPEFTPPPRHVLACCAVPTTDLRLRAA